MLTRASSSANFEFVVSINCVSSAFILIKRVFKAFKVTTQPFIVGNIATFDFIVGDNEPLPVLVQQYLLPVLKVAPVHFKLDAHIFSQSVSEPTTPSFNPDVPQYARFGNDLKLRCF